MHKRGFTLIELMVVVAIIALLASVILAGMSNARASARDKQRITSLLQVVNAIELYKSDNENIAPPHGGSQYGCNHQNCLAVLTNELVDDYIAELPFDPVYGNVVSNGYRYCRGPDQSQFTILMWHETGSLAPGWCAVQHGAAVNTQSSQCYMNYGSPTYGWCNEEI